MDIELLNPTTQIAATRIPAIKEKRVHRGKHLLYPENLPSWEVHKATLGALAERTTKRTLTEHAHSMLSAAIAWEIPTYYLPLRLDVIYFDDVYRGVSKVGKIEGIGGIPVHRFTRAYPSNAIVRRNDLPVLNYPYLLLELLQLPDPKQALVSADALLRKILQVTHTVSVAQEQQWLSILDSVGKLAAQYLSQRAARRVKRRSRYINPLAESPLETIVRVDLLRAGVVGIVPQLPFISEGGRYYADLTIPSNRLIVECDGQEKYALDPGKEAEAQRQKHLEAAGYKVVRINWEQAHTAGFIEDLVREFNLPVERRVWRW